MRGAEVGWEGRLSGFESKINSRNSQRRDEKRKVVDDDPTLFSNMTLLAVEGAVRNGS